MKQEEILEILEKSQNEFIGINESNLHSADIIAFQSAEITEQIAIEFAEWLMQAILDTIDLSKNNVDVSLSTRQLFKIFLEQTN